MTDPKARAQIDSGRLAEPFWYVDSPLTTTSAEHPFTGRPARGDVPAPAPGVLVPDAPVRVGRTTQRLRELARDGVLLITTPELEPSAVDAAVAREPGPARVLSLPEADVTGEVARALAVRPGEVWVLRPDAHIAAVLVHPTTDEVATVLDRITARGRAREDSHDGALQAVR